MDPNTIQAEDDQLITVDVARAVEERELLAYYQPVVDIESRAAVSAEALVRWTMPDGTIVPAGLFVPSLERTGTIAGLDWYMVGEVCALLGEVKGTQADIPVALNLSTCHADDPEFAAKLTAMADWHKVDHARLCIELSDAYLARDKASTDRLIGSIVEQGFTPVADNFSSGVAEMDILATLGVKVFKLARSLWEAATTEELVALREASRARDVLVSAEAVEEESELERLRAAGIALAQGYLFAKPMDTESFKSFCG